jgi:lipopolysaccharide export system protein LptA
MSTSPRAISSCARRGPRSPIPTPARSRSSGWTRPGGVFVTRGSESAKGDLAIYDFNKRIITMVGNVQLRRANGDNLNGGRMVIDLNSGVSSVGGGSGSAGKGGRVSGSFAVPKGNTN